MLLVVVLEECVSIPWPTHKHLAHNATEFAAGRKKNVFLRQVMKEHKETEP